VPRQYVPVIKALHARNQKLDQVRGCLGVTVHGMIRSSMQRLLNFRSNREIGICNPHRQDIPVTVLLPLGATAIASINFTIEIEHFGHLNPDIFEIASIICQATLASKRNDQYGLTCSKTVAMLCA
jgi:hypothetical protein